LKWFQYLDKNTIRKGLKNMTTFSITMAVVAAICSVLTIVFGIIAFSKNRTKEDTDEIKERTKELFLLHTRLVQIEKDVSYIRLSLDELKDWKTDFDKRLRIIENCFERNKNK